MYRVLAALSVGLLSLLPAGCAKCGDGQQPRPVKLDYGARDTVLQLDIELTGLRASKPYVLCIRGKVDQDGNELLKRLDSTPTGQGCFDFAEKFSDSKGVLKYDRSVDLPVGHYDATFALKDKEAGYKLVISADHWRFSIVPRPTESSGVQDRFSPGIRIAVPSTGGGVDCRKDASGIYHFLVSGSTRNLIRDSVDILLWVQPVLPPASQNGWFLQRPPGNGITAFAMDGSWSGVGQIGNADFPPHRDDILDVAVTVVSKSLARKLLKQPGEFMSEVLPGVAYDQVPAVKVRLYGE